MDLTQKQFDILHYIKCYQHEEGYPPTRAEIAQAFEFKSPNAADEHLHRLARKGAIQLVPGISRGIKVL
jgi:repressor LexA